MESSDIVTNTEVKVESDEEDSEERGDGYSINCACLRSRITVVVAQAPTVRTSVVRFP